jgi:hypothetical protein
MKNSIFGSPARPTRPGQVVARPAPTGRPGQSRPTSPTPGFANRPGQPGTRK